MLQIAVCEDEQADRDDLIGILLSEKLILLLPIDTILYLNTSRQKRRSKS